MQDNFSMHGWRLNQTINETEKIKGTDGKGCWKGYRYAGTENGKDKCVPVKENKGQCPDCGCEMEGKMCNECGYTMEEAATFTDKFDDSSELKGGQKDLPDALQAKILNKEGEDHEVSMAQNSLQSIISSASELLNKLGDEERDIPGWIQDHITNSENFIDQANQGFHELEPAVKTVDTDIDTLAETLDVNQTQLVAKEVAKGIILALKAENAEITALKVKNLEPNSFEVYVAYNDGSDDEFSFDVRGNKVVLSDFTFTEEVGTVDENGNVDKNEIKDNLLKVWAKHIKKQDGLEEATFTAANSNNPEGDKLVLRFLQGIAKKFDYPVSHAAMFVKERIKKLGY